MKHSTHGSYALLKLSRKKHTICTMSKDAERVFIAYDRKLLRWLGFKKKKKNCREFSIHTLMIDRISERISPKGICSWFFTSPFPLKHFLVDFLDHKWAKLLYLSFIPICLNNKCHFFPCNFWSKRKNSINWIISIEMRCNPEYSSGK